MGDLSYVAVEEARGLKGLRLVLTQGIPAPWGMAARVLYEIKKIPFVAVIQQAGAANEALIAWTGHNSAPVAMYDDERPRAIWWAGRGKGPSKSFYSRSVSPPASPCR